MPSHMSAKKQMRKSAKARIQNKTEKTFIKNLEKKVLDVISNKKLDMQETTTLLSQFKSKVDKAVTKGIYKRNKSSRLKSRADALFFQTFLKKEN